MQPVIAIGDTAQALNPPGSMWLGRQNGNGRKGVAEIVGQGHGVF
jgi:hypothetical protein